MDLVVPESVFMLRRICYKALLKCEAESKFSANSPRSHSKMITILILSVLLCQTTNLKG